MAKIIFALVALLYVPAVFAGTASGTVESIQVASDSPAVRFKLDAPIEDTPRCNQTGWFAFDLRKETGKTMLEVLLVAKQNGFTVSVEGLNTCVSDWKSENVKNLVIK
jgi:hypothetical protein